MSDERGVLQDPELEKHYQAMFSMFASEGWANFINDVTEYRANISDISAIDAEHTVDFRRGQRDILNWLLAQKSIHDVAYEDLLENGIPEAAS